MVQPDVFSGSRRSSRRPTRVQNTTHSDRDYTPLMENDTFTEQFYQSVNLIHDNKNGLGTKQSARNTSASMRHAQHYTQHGIVGSHLLTSQRTPTVSTIRTHFVDLPNINVNPAQDLSITAFSHGFCCCRCVRTQEVGFIERCGEFTNIADPGLHCLSWPLYSVSGYLCLRIQQIDVSTETITRDKIFVRITISLLLKVVNGMSYEAYYRPTDIKSQVGSSVLDAIRSEIPDRDLDDVYGSKKSIADRITTRLGDVLLEFGYEITNLLIQKIEPDPLVKDSMNAIISARRMKEAASHKAEAIKIEVVKQAEAQAERSYLIGKGISQERQAIIQGMKDTVLMWSEMDVRSMAPPAPKEIMDLLLVTQYLDLLVGLKGDSLFVRHDAQEVEMLLKERF